jgi:hypothetical protein
VERADIENELLEVLWLACNSYDPDRGAKFGTHFWNMARNRLIDLHKAASRKKRVGDYERVSLDSDAIRNLIELITVSSAEDEVLARITVIERFHSTPD